MTRTDTCVPEEAGPRPRHDCRPRAAKDSDDSRQASPLTCASSHPQHGRTGNLMSLPAPAAEAPARRRQRQPARCDRPPATDSDSGPPHGDTSRALGPLTLSHRPVPPLRPSGTGSTSGGPADPVKTDANTSPGSSGKGRRGRGNVRCTPVQSRIGLGAGRCFRNLRGGHPGRPENQNI